MCCEEERKIETNREREREKGRKRERDREREGEGGFLYISQLSFERMFHKCFAFTEFLLALTCFDTSATHLDLPTRWSRQGKSPWLST